jgi:hypothetical protein
MIAASFPGWLAAGPARSDDTLTSSSVAPRKSLLAMNLPKNASCRACANPKSDLVDGEDSRALLSALKVLQVNGFPVELLPSVHEETSWREMEKEYGLTKPQIVALKSLVNLEQSWPKMDPGSVPTAVDPSDRDRPSPALFIGNHVQYVGEASLEEAMVGPGSCLLNLICSAESRSDYLDTKDLILSVIHSQRHLLCEQQYLPDISMESLLAIRLYTMKLPIAFHSIVNRALNDPTLKGTENIAPYMKLLMTALRAMEKRGFGVNATAFRGVSTSGNDYLQRICDDYRTTFAEQNLLVFQGFTSVSQDADCAETFGDSIVFRFDNVRGVDISSVSVFPGEHEILLMPSAVFRVVGTSRVDEKLMVQLTQAEQLNADSANVYL